MAIVETPLTEAQILGFKGTVDFYYFRGKVVARQWPEKRKIPPTANEAANQTFFGEVQSKIHRMSEPNRQQWRDFVNGTNIIWTDAIRFFNLSENPDKELLPNYYFSRIEAKHYASFGWWLISVYFTRDDDASDYGSSIIANLSNTPFKPIVWQAVGEKRRRRAILSKMYRPQFTGFVFSADIGGAPNINELRARFFTTWRQDYIQLCAVPKSNKTAKRMQTPIITQKLNWIEA